MKKIVVLSAIAFSVFACKQTPKQAQEDLSDGWVSLFDGKTFDGWHAYNAGDNLNGWTIEEGAMYLDPSNRDEPRTSNLVTDKEYTNFELSLDWKIQEAGNSGFMWAVVEDEKYGEPYLTGPEIQVLDNAAHPDSFVRDGKHKAGALYDMIKPSDSVVTAAMHWNTCVLKINHLTNEGSVTLNGVNIVNFPVEGEGWEALVAESKFATWDAFGKSTSGKIALQDHGNKVWYKNIKIREIK